MDSLEATISTLQSAQNEEFRNREIQMETRIESLEHIIRTLQSAHSEENRCKDEQMQTTVELLERRHTIIQFAHNHEIRQKEKHMEMALKDIIESFESRTQCSICLRESGWILQCSYIFCRACMQRWKGVKEKVKYPMCRKVGDGRHRMYFTK